jgi:hypothetical protein
MNDFLTESCCDCLEIYNGISVTDFSIGKYCGTIGPRFVVSIWKHMALKFSSDLSINSKGFSVEYFSLAYRQSM